MRGTALILCAAALLACSNGKKAASTVANGGEAALVTPPESQPESSAARQGQANPIPPQYRPKLHLTLRSTPPGATAAIDGKAVGNTPALADVEADGRIHEFDFMLPGYNTYKLRFAPVRDGVIHATLTAVAGPADAAAP